MSFLEAGSIRLPSPLGTSSFNIRKVACHMMELQLEAQKRAILKIPITGRLWDFWFNHPIMKKLWEARDKLVDNYGNGLILGYQRAGSSIKRHTVMQQLIMFRKRHISNYHWTDCVFGKETLDMQFEEIVEKINPKDYWKVIEPADENSKEWQPNPEYKLRNWQTWNDAWEAVDEEAKKVKTKT